MKACKVQDKIYTGGHSNEEKDIKNRVTKG